MKTLFILIAVWAGLVSSQCFSSIPQCAQICLTNAATQSTSCGSTDWKCQCTSDNHQAIMQSAQNCMFASCGQATTEETVRSAVTAFCSAVNAGNPCSSSSGSAGGTSTTYTSTTTTASGLSETSSTGTRTATATAATSSSIAGAAVASHVGSFGMMALGALALI